MKSAVPLTNNCRCGGVLPVIGLLLSVISLPAVRCVRDLERCLELITGDATHAKLDSCVLDGTLSANPSETRDNKILDYIEPVMIQTQDGAVVSPSVNIRGKIFICECDKHRGIFAADTTLLFTNDGFGTHQKITVYPQLIENTDLVESIALTKTSIFLVIGGKVLVSEDNDRGILNFTQVSISNIETIISNGMLGVSGPTICYHGNQDMEENIEMYAWNRYSIYKFLLDQSKFHRVSWLQLHGSNRPDFRILHVQITANPDYLAVTSFFDNSMTIQRCSANKMYPGCGILATGMNATESQVLASAKFDFLAWNESTVTMVANNSLLIHKFNKTIDSVALSHGKNSWLVKTSDGDLHYAGIHSVKTETLNITLSANASITFITEDLIGEITYSVNEISRINVYDIKSLCTTFPNPPQFVPHILHTNVLLIGNALDTAVIQLASVTTSDDDSFDMVAYERFGMLPLMIDKTNEMTTFHAATKLVLRERKLTVTLSWNCSELIEICSRGYGLIELAYVPKEKQFEDTISAFHVRSHLYVVRAKCPTGLHLRLKMDEPEPANCSWMESPCQIKMRKQMQLFLKFELWQDQNFVNTVTSDVLLTELQNLTGFNYHDYNLLKKTCYQCSQFRVSNSPSKLILQTVRSACPCKLDGNTDSNGWIGNLSFANVYSSSNGEIILRFSAKALSSSFCDLSTEFNVVLLADHDLIYHYLEYVSMLVAVAIVSSALCISYFNYFKRTKDKQVVLSAR